MQNKKKLAFYIYKLIKHFPGKLDTINLCGMIFTSYENLLGYFYNIFYKKLLTLWRNIACEILFILFQHYLNINSMKNKIENTII